MFIREYISLAPYTTFGIGGPARWFAEAGDEGSVVETVEFARERQAPLFVLGGGSNLLVSDDGFPGVVLHITLPGVEQQGSFFQVAAGEQWDPFVSLAVKRGFGGIECLAGIPGTVGGTPVQNVGAYGQEVAETVVSVRALDLHSLNFVELPAAGCGFSYRRSIFNSAERNRYIVTGVKYCLRRDAAPVLSYPDLKQYFNNSNTSPDIEGVVSAVREIRRRKGMLLVEGEPDCRSAGSFFRNPVVPRSLYEEIASQAASGSVPAWSAQDGWLKISAAWLIEQSGFHKGFRMGAAGISSRHTLALINRGGASAKDIAALRDRIVAAVEQRFGIHLEPEPVWLGPEG